MATYHAIKGHTVVLMSYVQRGLRVGFKRKGIYTYSKNSSLHHSTAGQRSPADPSHDFHPLQLPIAGS
jgi:hypothetical protein